MPLTPDDVRNRLQPHLAELDKFGVRRLALFGSTAEGTATDESDLDFLVEFEPVTFDSYMEAKFYLEELFGKTVDLVTPRMIPPRELARLEPIVLLDAQRVS